MNNQGLVGIIVDAGHGGLDSGAVGNNLQEKDLTLQAATYMYNRLQELGIPAKMTRTNDEYLPKEERIKRVKSLYNNRIVINYLTFIDKCKYNKSRRERGINYGINNTCYMYNY